jgi:hypothetical protein
MTAIEREREQERTFVGLTVVVVVEEEGTEEEEEVVVVSSCTTLLSQACLRRPFAVILTARE